MLADDIKALESKDLEQNSETKICTEEQLSGRDSGISTDSSPRYHEARAKIVEAEHELEEKVLTSHKELQNAKKKLEELRLLRFEEKSFLQQEIDHLQDKVGEEEKNANFLEEQLKCSRNEKIEHERRLRDIEKEQNICSQINMMQEKEIVRLEMKLKVEESERVNATKQLDEHRRSIIEKDKLRIKQQNELYSLTEKLSQYEERNVIYRTENEMNTQKSKDLELELHAVKLELFDASRQLDENKTEFQSARLQMKQLKLAKIRLEEEVGCAQREASDLKGLNESLRFRFESQEKESQKRELILQHEFETCLTNESQLAEKCEQLECKFHATRRHNDEQNFEIKTLTERLKVLQTELERGEELKSDAEACLIELQSILKKHIVTTGGTSNLKSEDSSQEILVRELEDYFKEYAEKMRSYQAEISNLNDKVYRGECIMADLKNSFCDLKSELSDAQQSFYQSKKQKEMLEEQFNRANETLKIQEKDLKRKNEEVSNFRSTSEENERRVKQLEAQLEEARCNSSNNTILQHEIQRSLERKLQEIESDRKFTEEVKTKLEEKITQQQLMHEKDVKERNKANSELKSELQSLIDDNKNLAQRLIHLESYSDRLAEMLEKHQNESDRLKERLQKERTQQKNRCADKEHAINNLTEKMNELKCSVSSSSELNERLHLKAKTSKEEVKSMEVKYRKLKSVNEDLVRKERFTREAYMSAERKTTNLTEQLESVNARFAEQTKNVEEMFGKIHTLETEKSVLRETFAHAENRLRVREATIEELSARKENDYNSLRLSVEQAEVVGREFEEKLQGWSYEKQSLEKQMREGEAENRHLRTQLTNLQQLLAKAEDDKEMTLSELARFERDNQMHDMQVNAHTQASIKQLQQQVSSLESALETEKRRREKLEEMYNRRDDQMNHLRSTFDHSLSNITKDTNNIKSILGKSLQKIDRHILNNDSADSDVNTEENFQISNSKYLNLPSKQRTPVKEERSPKTYRTPSKLSPELSLLSQELEYKHKHSSKRLAR